MEPLLVEVKGEVLTATLNRPEKLNALNEEIFEALHRLFVYGVSGVKVVILRGAGQRAFSAGADLAMLRSMNRREANRMIKRAHETMRLIASADQIVLTSVKGYILGGGLELALAADLIVAEEGAIFGMPELELGLIPGFGGTKRLPARIGRSLALEMMLLGKKITAQEALEAGLADRVVKEAYAESVSLAEQMAKRSFEALRSVKRALRAEDDWTERELFLECLMSDEAKRRLHGSP